MSEKKPFPESIKYLLKNHPGDTDGDEASIPSGKSTMIASVGGPGKSTFFDNHTAHAIAARGRILVQETEANCTYGVGSEYVEVKRHPLSRLQDLKKTAYYLTFYNVDIDDTMKEKIKNAIDPYMIAHIDKNYHIDILVNVVLIVIDRSLFEEKDRNINVIIIPKIMKLFGKKCSVKVENI